MTGWLIYDEIGGNRNRWFIHQLIKEAKRNGINLNLKIVSDDLFKPVEIGLPNFAIVRTIEPKINEFFEKNGIRTFNNYRTSFIANNKWKTYNIAKTLGIPVMKTELVEENKSLEISFPFVLKSLDGHGGTEVFMIATNSDYERATKCLGYQSYIVQEVCSHVGLDMRVYTLGHTILAGIIRQSDSDFRSNYSLGGAARIAEVSHLQIEIIEKIVATLDSDLIGIDFIYHNNKWVLNEIEDVVGTRMLYKYTNINVALQYITYIKSKMGI